MKRFLVTGDIHIGDYAKYNLTYRFRLKQFETLAKRFVQMKYEYHLDSIIIAGDILRECVMRPYVMYQVREFIKTLCTAYSTVYFTYGNHDVDVKVNDVTDSDSLVSLLEDIPNFIVMDHECIWADECKIYFESWSHKHEIDPEQESDVYISHINMMPGFGQEVNNKKFRYGIFGDYHAEIQTENMYSTSTPIQHYVSDPREGSVIILSIDGKDIDIKRVKVENEEYKFLKIYKEDEYPKNPTELDVVVRKAKTEGTETAKSTIDIKEASKDINKSIETEVKANQLEDIHREVLAGLKMPEVIDLNFSLQDFYILNYRSIKEFKLDFSDVGKGIYLAGLNGSGKSSFLRALCYVLFDDPRASNQITHGETYCEVGVTLSYQGHLHQIIRGTGVLIYKIDDIQQDSNNKRALNDTINQNLPFLKCLGDFILNSKSVFFGNCDRVGLLTKIFNLDVLETYLGKAKLIKGECENNIKKEEKQIIKYEGELQANEDNYNSSKDKLDKFSTSMRSKSEVTKDISDIDSTISSRNSIKSKLDLLKTQIANIESNSTESIADLESGITNIESQLTELNSELTLSEEYTELNREYKSNYAEYNRLKSQKESSTVTCPHCNKTHVINFDETKLTTLGTKLSEDYKVLSEHKGKNLVRSDIKSKIDLLNSDLNAKRKAVTKLESLKDLHVQLSEQERIFNTYPSETEIKELEEKKEKLNSELTEISQYEYVKSITDELAIKIQKCRDIIQSSKDIIDNENLKLNKCIKYISLFDMSNIDSVPNKLLKLIAEKLSDDDIKFTTLKKLKSGEDRFHVSCSLNVDGDWIDFDDTSDGQQALLGLCILSKLTQLLPGLGLVILDEPLKHVDEVNISLCIKAIKSINTNNLFISSHSLSFDGYDSKIEFELIDKVSRVELLK